MAQPGAFNILLENGFENAFGNFPSSSQAGGPTSGILSAKMPGYLFVRRAVFKNSPKMLSSTKADTSLAIHDLIIGPAAMSTAEGTRTGPPGIADLFNPSENFLLWPILGAAVTVLVFFLGRSALGILRARREPQPSPSRANFSTALSRTTYVNRLAGDVSPGGAVTEAPTETASSDVPLWRQHAVDAEHRAEQAKEAARDRLMPHLARMMKDKLLWRLLAQRSQTIRLHDASARVVAELEQRLALIQSHFESRVQSYENRIVELERELAAKESINRELLESRIQSTRMALEQAPPPAHKPSVVYTLRFGDLMARKATVKTRTRQETDTL